MRAIAPPAKGTLSTTASPVNQLRLDLAGAVPTPPSRVVVGRLYDKRARVAEPKRQPSPRPAPTSITAPRSAVQARVTPPESRAAAPATGKPARAAVAAPADTIVRVVLIGCSKSKRAGRHPARALYQGALFKAALAHAQRIGAEAFVVSARHGLVQLDTELDAYEHRLRPDERETWAWTVCVALRRQMKGRRFAVTIFAGETYADPLQRYLAVLDPVIEVVTPLAGLSLGAQLRWFRVVAELAGGAE